MPKRFSDTDKWKKVWFRELKPIHKCFWEYIRDNCNNAGIWDVDFKLASFQIGTRLNQGEIETVFEKQFIKINNNKWFLTDFIEWQYNCSIDGLNPKNNAHLSAIRILDKFKIKELIEGLVRAQSAPKDKDKDKNKAKDVDKNINIEFEKFWNLYDYKKNKPDCEKLWNSTKKTKQGHIINDETRILIMERLPKYIENTYKDNNYPGRKYPHTYLFGECWNDEVVKINNKIVKKREIIGYIYDCYHCGKSYTKEKSGTYRCTENDCQIEMRGEGKKREIVGAKLDLIKILDKK